MIRENIKNKSLKFKKKENTHKEMNSKSFSSSLLFCAKELEVFNKKKKSF